jgi:hypothetical protein
LFKGHTLGLQTFAVFKVTFSWSLVPCSQLAWLKITLPNEDLYSPGDINQLIDLLVNCLAWEMLDLDSCLRLSESTSHIRNLIHDTQVLILNNISLALRLRKYLNR